MSLMSGCAALASRMFSGFRSQWMMLLRRSSISASSSWETKTRTSVVERPLHGGGQRKSTRRGGDKPVGVALEQLVQVDREQLKDDAHVALADKVVVHARNVMLVVRVRLNREKEADEMGGREGNNRGRACLVEMLEQLNLDHALLRVLAPNAVRGTSSSPPAGCTRAWRAPPATVSSSSSLSSSSSPHLDRAECDKNHNEPRSLTLVEKE